MAPATETSAATAGIGLLCLCRQGFEPELAGELNDRAGHAGIAGYARTQRNDGYVVFVTDDPARVGKAYWGPYGLAKQGLVALVRQLSAETDATPVRVSALEPGPMRTDLRARAYADEAQLRVPSPAAYAPACVHLLAPAGAAHRGQVFAPRVPS